MLPRLPCKAVWTAYQLGRASGFVLTYCPKYDTMEVSGCDRENSLNPIEGYTARFLPQLFRILTERRTATGGPCAFKGRTDGRILE